MQIVNNVGDKVRIVEGKRRAPPYFLKQLIGGIGRIEKITDRDHCNTKLENCHAWFYADELQRVDQNAELSEFEPHGSGTGIKGRPPVPAPLHTGRAVQAYVPPKKAEYWPIEVMQQPAPEKKETV